MGHQISILGRDLQKINNLFGDTVTAISWQAFDSQPGDLMQNADIVLNLCGENIASRRWSSKRKQTLIDSRIIPTQKLAKAIGNSQRSIHFISCSGISIYGLQKQLRHDTPIFTEDNPPSSSHAFMVLLAKQAEQASEDAKKNPNAITTHLRIAPVLSMHGGVIKRLLPAYRINFGGRIGYGDQPFAWIQLQDLLEIIPFLIAKRISGPINCIAPEHINQEDFTHALGERLNRSSEFFIPEWIIKLLFGQMGDECLLHGQKAMPKILLEHNFEFNYPSIYSALNSPT